MKLFIRYCLIFIVAATLDFFGFFDSIIPNAFEIEHKAMALKSAWCDADLSERLEVLTELKGKGVSFDVICDV